jgi:hypothetical protein
LKATLRPSAFILPCGLPLVSGRKLGILDENAHFNGLNSNACRSSFF